MKKEHDEKTLPLWAQNKLYELRNAIDSLEGLRKLSGFLADDERDWFVLTDPVNGCTDDKLSLWLLNADSPFRVCTLYKGDKLFIGRATKARYGLRLTGITTKELGIEAELRAVERQKELEKEYPTKGVALGVKGVNRKMGLTINGQQTTILRKEENAHDSIE